MPCWDTKMYNLISSVYALELTFSIKMVLLMAYFTIEYPDICRHFRHSSGSLPLLQQPVFGINIGTWASEMGRESARQLVILSSNASLSLALTLLMEGVH